MRKEAVVKINADLLKKVSTFILRKENRLKYINKKQFIDLAVYEKLEKETGKGAKNEHR